MYFANLNTNQFPQTCVYLCELGPPPHTHILSSYILYSPFEYNVVAFVKYLLITKVNYTRFLLLTYFNHTVDVWFHRNIYRTK